MTDHANMRLRLQNVAAYRELCRGVQRGGRENVVFAFLMLVLGYFAFQGGGRPADLIPFAILIVGELLVGLVKWVAPSAECMILDGLVLVAFAGYNFWRLFDRFQAGGQPETVRVFFGLLMLYLAFGRFRAYTALRQLFADRPTPEHLAWFDDLVREIRASDPDSDRGALDLPTSPHWRAKLLGSTAFFVAGQSVLIVGPDDFSLVREKTERGTGRRKALLRVQGEPYPEFELDDASWSNYTAWVNEQTASRS